MSLLSDLDIVQHVRSNISSGRLRSIYLKDSTTMKGFELDRLFLSLKFENDEDAIKMVIFYFTELVMVGRENATNGYEPT